MSGYTTADRHVLLLKAPMGSQCINSGFLISACDVSRVRKFLLLFARWRCVVALNENFSNRKLLSACIKYGINPGRILMLDNFYASEIQYSTGIVNVRGQRVP